MRSIIKRGDIFWYNFGQAKGSEQGGVRPVIVIQNDVGNKFSPTVIVAVITSQIKNNQPTQVNIKEYLEIGLKSPSKILTEQTRTIDKKFLGDYIGRVNGETLKELNRALQISVGTVVIKPKNIELIEKKAKHINFNEMHAYKMKRNGCTNDKYYKMLINEIKQDLRELEVFCNQKGLDYKRFYKSYENILKERTVAC